MKTLIVAIPALFIAAWVWAQFMSIERVGTTPLVRISWPGQGVLETSTNLRTWTASSITTSPHEVRTTTSPATFYRVRFFADTLITNAVVHTMNGAQPQAESIAILNGNIAFVGSNEHAEDLIGQQTSLIDAGGRVVLPGLHDAHLHVIEAGINADLCLLPQFGSAAQYRTALRQCLAGQPGTGWVFGAGVNMDNLLNTVASPLDLIDDEIPDRPAVIIDDLGHGAWANRLALAAVGFDLLTNDPPGGILDVDNMGNLSGVVFESAGQTLVDAAFPPTAAN
ncbi:MAG: amidohydrolase family protein, partial [Verrucomicrobiota bacterium]